MARGIDLIIKFHLKLLSTKSPEQSSGLFAFTFNKIKLVFLQKILLLQEVLKIQHRNNRKVHHLQKFHLQTCNHILIYDREPHDKAQVPQQLLPKPKMSNIMQISFAF